MNSHLVLLKLSRLGGALSGAPAEDVAFEAVQQAVEEHHGEHEDEDAADGAGGVELVGVELDHVAEAAGGGHELADDGADERERHPDLERGHDPRRGRGQADLGEDLTLAGPITRAISL